MKRLKIGKRKVGRKGAGCCVMLPSVWLRSTDVHAGDSLQIEIYGSKLVLEPEVKQK